jgi:hypothetical protein
MQLNSLVFEDTRHRSSCPLVPEISVSIFSRIRGKYNRLGVTHGTDLRHKRPGQRYLHNDVVLATHSGPYNELNTKRDIGIAHLDFDQAPIERADSDVSIAGQLAVPI